MTVSILTKQQNFKKPPFCDPALTVFDAAAMIADLDINALAVVQEGGLVGIITDHDIIRCLADTGENFRDQTVGDWMTEKVLTCSLETPLSKALNLMAGRGIRHLVVVKGESKPVTVVSSKELLTRIHENDELEIRVLRDLARATQVASA